MIDAWGGRIILWGGHGPWLVGHDPMGTPTYTYIWALLNVFSVVVCLKRIRILVGKEIYWTKLLWEEVEVVK